MGAKTTDDPTRAGPPLVPDGLVIDDVLTIRGLLGQGGMAQVFRAHQAGLEREVALKVTRPTRDRDRERFLREARSLGRLKHPNAVAAHTAGCFEHDEKDFWYISMELVEGVTLKQRLETDGPLPLAEVLDIAGDIAGALQEAHELGIIHRDLKPSNIMLEDDEGGHARVLDFGVAKLLGNDDPLTTDGEVLGSPRYMSPEQFQQDEVDQRSDIYSLGLIMFEMLIGKHPLGKKASLSDMMEWLQKPEIPTPALNDLTPRVARFVRRCLRRDPAERFENMKELMVELQALRTRSLPPKPRRRWLGLAAAVALVCGVLVFFAVKSKVEAPGDAPVMDSGEGETFVLLTPRTDTFWTASSEFASAAAVALGKRLLVFDAQDDGDAMVRQARATNDAAGIISQDFIGHGSAIERSAAERETPFFAINNRFDEGVPQSAVASLRPNDETTGYALARALIDATHERSPGATEIRVIAVQGTEGEFATDERRAGLQRALSEHNDFDIVARIESGFTNQVEARDGVRRALQGLSEGSPIVIWCATDAMALGAVQGAIQAGREPGSDVLIGGVDWTRDALLAVQDGTLHVSYGGHFMEAGFAIILAEAALPRVDPVQLYTPMRPATRENVEDVLGLFRTGAFERIDFRDLVRRVRAGRAEETLDPWAILASP